MKQTPEQRAEARYKMDHYTHQVQREAYATCIREEVEPRDETIERLRALVQELVDSDAGVNPTKYLLTLASAKQQGFVPTNTEDK